MRPPPSHAALAALLAAVALAAADFSFDRDCAKLLPDWDKAAPPALRQLGAERQLWLAWRDTADRASAALLLREVARHPRCGRLRCRLALCRVEGGLCDLLDRTDASDSAFIAGFEPLSRMSCGFGRQVCAVGHQVAPFQWREPALLVTEKVPLQMHAPWLLEMMERHAPDAAALSGVAAREADPAGPEGAARGAAALDAAAAPAATASPAPRTPATRYRALVYVCEEDRWTDALMVMLNSLSVLLTNETEPRGVEVQLETKSVRCASDSQLGRELADVQAEPGAHALLGAVAAGAGAARAAAQAGANGLALVAYDVQAGGGGARAPLEAGPRADELAQALGAAMRGCGWGRAALLSQEDAASARVAERLRAPGPLRRAALSADEATLRATLRSLRAERTGAVVLNADGAGAARALRLAAQEGLAGCAWLAREWTAGAAPQRLLALRTTPRSAAEAGAADGAAAALARAWPGGRWPARAAPLAEALQTLTAGFARLFEAHEELRYDHVHAGDTLGLLRKNLENDTRPLRGVARDLAFDARGVRPRPPLLELWEANATAGRELTAGALPAACPAAGVAPHCELPAGGDEYAAAVCLDLPVAVGAPALLLAALVAGYGAAALRRRRAARARARRVRLRAEAGAALLARQPHAGPALRALLVERERVTLLRALGAGRHGRVWLARLAPGGAPLAAKGPLAGAAPAEEGELLREAAALAPLRHAHVLRLLGVCVGPGPPLLLTALAPHGDLLRYLRARRPPAGGADEARHVAAPALTRLAREAALALAYLASRGVVHRDVRAANCLLDERRALRLADFGMARRLGADGPARRAADGGEYYACRRRALFPVLWMAPESLSRGAFSAASDVWALGVLALELVTLGARPFGALGAAEAAALVARGGHARLPGGASAATRRLARLCWRRAAGARPSAAEVAEWLAAQPAALAPCPPAPDAEAGAEDEDAAWPDRSGSGSGPAGRCR